MECFKTLNDKRKPTPSLRSSYKYYTCSQTIYLSFNIFAEPFSILLTRGQSTKEWLHQRKRDGHSTDRDQLCSGNPGRPPAPTGTQSALRICETRPVAVTESLVRFRGVLPPSPNCPPGTHRPSDTCHFLHANGVLRERSIL